MTTHDGDFASFRHQDFHGLGQHSLLRTVPREMMTVSEEYYGFLEQRFSMSTVEEIRNILAAG